MAQNPFIPVPYHVPRLLPPVSVGVPSPYPDAPRLSSGGIAVAVVVVAGVHQAAAHERVQAEAEQEGAQQQRVVRGVPGPRRQESVGGVPRPLRGGRLLSHGGAGPEGEERDEPVVISARGFSRRGGGVTFA